MWRSQGGSDANVHECSGRGTFILDQPEDEEEDSTDSEFFIFPDREASLTPQ